MSTVSYPPAPWDTAGHAFIAPYAVRVSDLSLPRGMSVAHPGPFTVGRISYVNYSGASPLYYDELIWMPAFMRDRSWGAKAKGWFVSVMYVNERNTLAAGREIWKLPKTMATFEPEEGGMRIRSDEGGRQTELQLQMRAFGPTRALEGATTTLQAHDGEARCRFRAKFNAQVSAASMSVPEFQSDDPAFMGFVPSRRLPKPAIAQRSFASVMEEPLFLPRL